MIRNLYDNSQIQKKILIPSNMRKNFYATDGDIVTYNMKCIYKQKEIYNKEQVKSDLDCSLDEVRMLEIEHRILENIKINILLNFWIKIFEINMQIIKYISESN
jgi:hypothetical protein